MTVRAAKNGKFVDPIRLATAQSLLLQHHGTRGTAVADMAPSSAMHIPWHREARNGNLLPPPAPDDWRCEVCTGNLDNDDMPWFCKHDLDTCPKCNKKKPKNVTKFCQTNIGKATAAAGSPTRPGPKAKAKAAAAAGGGGGDSKRLKELQDKLKAADKRIAAEKKKAEVERKRADAADAAREEEFQDAGEGDEEVSEDGCEEWQE